MFIWWSISHIATSAIRAGHSPISMPQKASTSISERLRMSNCCCPPMQRLEHFNFQQTQVRDRQ